MEEKNENKVEVEFSKDGKNIKQVLEEIFKNAYKNRIIEENFRTHN